MTSLNGWKRIIKLASLLSVALLCLYGLAYWAASQIFSRTADATLVAINIIKEPSACPDISERGSTIVSKFSYLAEKVECMPIVEYTVRIDFPIQKTIHVDAISGAENAKIGDRLVARQVQGFDGIEVYSHDFTPDSGHFWAIIEGFVLLFCVLMLSRLST